MPKPDPQFIIPFAKPPGITSFTSLWQVKHALGTKKVGHTGTLDSFADGLLVLLSGKLTKLVPYITDFDKTYRVLFYFGKETDTLDPEGTVIDEKPLPVYADFVVAIRELTGIIEQVPPVYSAVKQAGERLSDRIRRGEAITVSPRTVTVYSIDIEEIFYEKAIAAPESDMDNENPEADTSQRVFGAVLCVRCSKGTYIRSLVRDIAHRCGSAAYVYALRRTAVGPFALEQAAGYSTLQPFGQTAALHTVDADSATVSHSITEEEIKQAALPLSEDLACAMHFQETELKEQYYAAFMNGKPISGHWFTSTQPLSDGGTVAVFCEGRCAGLMTKNGNRFHYEAVFNQG